MFDPWDFASLLLKILSAGAAITGVALPLMDAANVKLVRLTRGQLVAATAGFISAAIVFGMADFTISKRSEVLTAPMAAPKPTIEIQQSGDIVKGANNTLTKNVEIGSITIMAGETTEERAKKRQQAEDMVSAEVAGTISALDARLGFIDVALEPDSLAKRLAATNEHVAPAAADQWGTGYRSLIAEQRAASLRGAFNSQPLHTELAEPLLRQMMEVGTDPSAVRSFFDAEVAVAQKSDDLLDLVAHPTSLSDTTLDGRLLTIQRDTIRAWSTVAYLRGLQLLRALGVNSQSSLAPQFPNLHELEPRYLPAPDELEELQKRASQRVADSARAKEAFKRDAESLVENRLKEFRDTADQIVQIKPSDPWNEVVRKATLLRGAGRIDEAVAAYRMYGEMFAASDKTATRYSHTAQSFTRQFQHLNVNGGAYIYAIKNGGNRPDGLMEGDIIVKYDDHDVRGSIDLENAVESRPPAPGTVIVYLRLLDDGSFARGIATLTANTLDFATMPI